jgi:hypothetical protein
MLAVAGPVAELEVENDKEAPLSCRGLALRGRGPRTNASSGWICGVAVLGATQEVSAGASGSRPTSTRPKVERYE